MAILPYGPDQKRIVFLTAANRKAALERKLVRNGVISAVLNRGDALVRFRCAQKADKSLRRREMTRGVNALNRCAIACCGEQLVCEHGNQRRDRR
jgi:hypothetical protein